MKNNRRDAEGAERDAETNRMGKVEHAASLFRRGEPCVRLLLTRYEPTGGKLYQ